RWRRSYRSIRFLAGRRERADALALEKVSRAYGGRSPGCTRLGAQGSTKRISIASDLGCASVAHIDRLSKRDSPDHATIFSSHYGRDRDGSAALPPTVGNAY